MSHRIPDYSLNHLKARADTAKLFRADYLDGLEREYLARRRKRHQRRIPAVAFCGMGRAGKDTSAEYVCKKFDIVYPKSASWQALPLVAHMAGVSEEQAWAERHANRVFWIHACNALREGDLTLLARLCLGAGDVLVGPRAKPEFEAYKAEKTLDWTVWIDNPRVPSDPTVEYTAGDCDLMIPNHGTVEMLYEKLDKLMPALYHRH